jgi:hypothetical protein
MNVEIYMEEEDPKAGEVPDLVQCKENEKMLKNDEKKIEANKKRSTKLKKELMNLLGKQNDFPVELLLQND